MITLTVAYTYKPVRKITTALPVPETLIFRKRLAMSQMMKRKRVQQHSVTSLNKKAECKMAILASQ